MGARPEDYKRSAPEHSYIHVEDFAEPKELAMYLHKLDQNDDLYNEYFQWKVLQMRCWTVLKSTLIMVLSLTMLLLGHRPAYKHQVHVSCLRTVARPSGNDGICSRWGGLPLPRHQRLVAGPRDLHPGVLAGCPREFHKYKMMIDWIGGNYCNYLYRNSKMTNMSMWKYLEDTSHKSDFYCTY